MQEWRTKHDVLRHRPLEAYPGLSVWGISPKCYREYSERNEILFSNNRRITVFGPIMGSGNYLACFTRFICLFIFFLMVIVNKQTYVFKN